MPSLVCLLYFFYLKSHFGFKSTESGTSIYCHYIVLCLSFWLELALNKFPLQRNLLPKYEQPI